MTSTMSTAAGDAMAMDGEAGGGKRSRGPRGGVLAAAGPRPSDESKECAVRGTKALLSRVKRDGEPLPGRLQRNRVRSR